MSNADDIYLLQVRKNHTYGNVKFEPLNETARKFCKLVGQKSLSEARLKQIKTLGFRVLIMPDQTEPVEF